MKKYKSFHFNSKTFKELFFSLLGIAFMAFGLVGLVVIRHVADNMKQEQVRISQNKIYTILEDLENQDEVLRDMAVKFASYPEFRINEGDNKYKEIQILDTLQYYNFASGIADQLFLKYASNNNAYTFGGATLPLKVFLMERVKFSEADTKEIMDILEDNAAGEREEIRVLRKNSHILFIFPLKTYASSREGTAEFFCAVSSTDILQERIRNFVGDVDGTLAIYYNDVCIYGEEVSKDGEYIESMSTDGKVRAEFQLNARDYFSMKTIFSVNEAVVFLVIAVILIVLAIVVASWNFRPIRRIAERYENVLDGNVSDWGDVERMIDSLLDMKEKKQEVLLERYSKLREQVVALVVAGEYSYKLENFMTLLNIKWNASFFGLIKCILNENDLTMDRGEKIRKGIEELSGDGLYLYPHKEDEGVWNVLVAAEESYQLEETMELLQSVFEIMELYVDMELTSKGSDLKELCRKESGSTLTDSNAMDAEVLQPEEAELGDENKARSKKESGLACQIAAYIKDHCTDYNISLELVAQEFQITTSYLCRIIKQQVGMSYKEYLTELRIAEAKRLLMEEELSVTEVCMRVGYTNTSNFIRVFQKYTGMTPAKFRDTNQG